MRMFLYKTNNQKRLKKREADNKIREEKKWLIKFELIHSPFGLSL